MNHEDYEKAANYWKEKDADNVCMLEEQLKKAVDDYILANNICTLATGFDEFVRCTPIEYTYHDGAFWMFSEGGEKFHALEHNKNVCIAIYDKYEGFGKLKGLQVTGRAQIVEPFSEEYIAATEFKKIPIEALKKLTQPMHLIRVVPVKVEFLSSDFKKEGYAVRQKLVCEMNDKK